MKRLELCRLPPVLIIHLKRFIFNAMQQEKLVTPVMFPTRGLDLSYWQLRDTAATATEADVYDLVAVSNHHGYMGSGHYTSYALNNYDHEWYLFDDTSVSMVTEESVITPNAYILIYVLRPTRDN